MNMIVIYTACATMDGLRKIADALIDKNLVACINILPPIQAVYRWKGRIEDAQEIPMLIKTLPEYQDKAVALIKQMHSYEVPGIVMWEAQSLNSDYSDWMKGNLGQTA